MHITREKAEVGHIKYIRPAYHSPTVTHQLPVWAGQRHDIRSYIRRSCHESEFHLSPIFTLIPFECSSLLSYIRQWQLHSAAAQTTEGPDGASAKSQ